MPLARYSSPKLGLVRAIDCVQLNAASSSIADVGDMYSPRLTVHVPPDDPRDRHTQDRNSREQGRRLVVRMEMCGALPGEIHKPQVKQANCAHFVLNSTSLQLIPAYSSQSWLFPSLLARLGLNEPECAGVGW
jgi:hypothetical protein